MDHVGTLADVEGPPAPPLTMDHVGTLVDTRKMHQKCHICEVKKYDPTSPPRAPNAPEVSVDMRPPKYAR